MTALNAAYVTVQIFIHVLTSICFATVHASPLRNAAYAFVHNSTDFLAPSHAIFEPCTTGVNASCAAYTDATAIF